VRGAGSASHQFQRLEADIGTELFHRSAFGKPHRPTQRGQALLEALDQRHVRTLMNAALGPVRMPGKAVIAAAEATVRQRRNPSPPKPFDNITVQRICMTRTLRTLLEDSIDHGWAEFYGYEIIERLGIQAGTIYPLLTRLHNAGWLTSRFEDEQQWLAGAPPGRGPGRRRTYFTFTTDGRRAALRELETRRKKPSASG
jgi:DNA-binding PadR family transcriptional regulator